MRVLVVSDKGGVSEFYRAVAPYTLLHEAGLIEMTIDDGRNPALISNLHRFESIVFSRTDSPEHSLLMAYAKMQGLRTIYDVDDNLILLPPSIGCYDAWHARGNGIVTPRLWHFKNSIRVADVLTVSTPAMGRQLCDGEPHSLRPKGDYLVLPNQVVGAEWADVTPAEKGPGEIWVGWWGIYNHWDDWRDVAPYIEPVIAARPRVKLVLLGMPELAHLFPRLRKYDQLIVGPFVRPDELGEYRSLVKAFDVALAPTSPCPFNESKSDLKMLQYGAAGVPVIASQTTYQDWRGFATILADPAGWGQALEFALDNPAIMRRDARRLQERVLSSRTYEGNFKRWLAALGMAPEPATPEVLEIGISEVMEVAG